VGDDRLANVLGAFALALADGMDVTTERAALVALSDLLQGRSVDDLRRAVGLTHSGGVRVVDRLVAGGLVERRRGADGRTVALFLTADGRRLAGQARDARLAALHDVLVVLDDRERAQLAAIVDKLVAAMVGRRLQARAAGVDPPGGWLCRLCDPVACERAQGHCPVANAARAAS
jgi:MarR family transcriptional regulator, negative regulator of the multidrug operon emrRAB